MLTKDKIKIHKLRRRLAISYIIIFSLIVWLKNKFDDAEFYIQENTLLNYQLINKDRQVENLSLQIKSYQKEKENKKPKIQKLKKIINTEKTTEIEQKVDSSSSNIEIKEEEIDTLKNND